MIIRFGHTTAFRASGVEKEGQGADEGDAVFVALGA